MRRRKKHGKVYNSKAFQEGWERIFGPPAPDDHQTHLRLHAEIERNRKVVEAVPFKKPKVQRFSNSKTFELASSDDFDAVPLVDNEDTHLRVGPSRISDGED